MVVRAALSREQLGADNGSVSQECVPGEPLIRPKRRECLLVRKRDDVNLL